MIDRFQPRGTVKLLAMIAKAFLVGPLVIACFSHGVSAQENRSFASLEFVLSNDQLSQQTIWPFRLHDDLIDAQHPMWNEYERALASHPTTQSCLLPDAESEKGWNLAEVNWAGMRDHRDIDVCLFRIADSLGSPDRMQEWFIAQGYDSKGPQQLLVEGRGLEESDGWIHLEAYLDGAVFDPRMHFETTVLRSFLVWLLPSGPPHHRDHAMVLEYSKSGRIVAIASLRRGG